MMTPSMTKKMFITSEVMRIHLIMVRKLTQMTLTILFTKDSMAVRTILFRTAKTQIQTMMTVMLLDHVMIIAVLKFLPALGLN